MNNKEVNITKTKILENLLKTIDKKLNKWYNNNCQGELNMMGIVRRIDDLGRIVIPKEIRKAFAIKEGDPMEIYIKDHSIIIKKANFN